MTIHFTPTLALGLAGVLSSIVSGAKALGASDKVTHGIIVAGSVLGAGLTTYSQTQDWIQSLLNCAITYFGSHGIYSGGTKLVRDAVSPDQGG